MKIIYHSRSHKLKENVTVVGKVDISRHNVDTKINQNQNGSLIMSNSLRTIMKLHWKT